VALAADVAGLAEALGDGPAFVVGNDWGGIATHAASSLRPEAVRRAVAINVGHPATFLKTLLHPHQVHHIFHFWFFQLDGIAAGAVRANDLALVDYLWDYWSAPGHDYADHLARVKSETLAPEGAVEAGISYYPGLMNMLTEQPEAAERMQGTIDVPTLTIFGDHDPPREMSADEHRHFGGDYRLEIVEGAGHFVHREQPDAVNRLILDWLGDDSKETR
jgi:pimeloyl-ACP methyl ester carboxylesterase